MRFTPFLIVVWLCSGSVALAQNTFSLENAFQSDETLFLQLDTTIRGASIMDDVQNPFEAYRETVLAYRTLEISDEGSASIEVDLERMLMTVPSMNRREPMNLMETVMQDTEALYAATVSPSGEISTEANPDTLTDSGIRGVNQSPLEYLPYIRLPQGGVRINQSWNHSWEVPFTDASKPIIAYATYTLLRVDEEDGVRIATIETESTIAEDNVSFGVGVTAQTAGQFRIAFSRYRISSTGEIRFDGTHGRMLSFDDDKRIEMDYDADAMLAGAEFPSSQQLILRQITKGTCSSTLPDPILVVETEETP